jgi:hypothetical protein
LVVERTASGSESAARASRRRRLLGPDSADPFAEVVRRLHVFRHENLKAVAGQARTLATSRPYPPSPVEIVSEQKTWRKECQLHLYWVDITVSIVPFLILGTAARSLGHCAAARAGVMTERFQLERRAVVPSTRARPVGSRCYHLVRATSWPLIDTPSRVSLAAGAAPTDYAGWHRPTALRPVDRLTSSAAKPYRILPCPRSCPELLRYRSSVEAGCSPISTASA